MNNKKKTKQQVFISYAKEDSETAKKLYKYLDNNKIDAWIDMIKLKPGQNWKREIRKSIRESAFFLALLSSNSLTKKGYVQKELKIAYEVLDELPDNDIFLIPLRLDKKEPKDEKLHQLHWVDLFPSYQAGMEKLLNVINPEKKIRNTQKKNSYKHLSIFLVFFIALFSTVALYWITIHNRLEKDQVKIRYEYAELYEELDRTGKITYQMLFDKILKMKNDTIYDLIMTANTWGGHWRSIGQVITDSIPSNQEKWSDYYPACSLHGGCLNYFQRKQGTIDRTLTCFYAFDYVADQIGLNFVYVYSDLLKAINKKGSTKFLEEYGEPIFKKSIYILHRAWKEKNKEKEFYIGLNYVLRESKGIDFNALLIEGDYGKKYFKDKTKEESWSGTKNFFFRLENKVSGSVSFIRKNLIEYLVKEKNYNYSHPAVNSADCDC